MKALMLLLRRTVAKPKRLLPEVLFAPIPKRGLSDLSKALLGFGELLGVRAFPKTSPKIKPSSPLIPKRFRPYKIKTPEVPFTPEVLKPESKRKKSRKTHFYLRSFITDIVVQKPEQSLRPLALTGVIQKQKITQRQALGLKLKSILKSQITYKPPIFNLPSTKIKPPPPIMRKEKIKTRRKKRKKKKKRIGRQEYLYPVRGERSVAKLILK
ncbi:MAG: hypothetical protein ACTSSG_14045 [Candidatus Heimdallarchaeaceae archaeon]